MHVAIAGPTREEQFRGVSLLMKPAGSADAVGQGIRRATIGIGARAEHHNDVGGASIISFAEAEHLSERKEEDTSGAHERRAKQVAYAPAGPRGAAELGAIPETNQRNKTKGN